MSIIDPGAGPESVSHGGGQGHGHGEHDGHDGHDHGTHRRYLRVFKYLHRGEVATIEHGMRTQPLVDVYELQPFEAAVSADETVEPQKVHFYLYHTRDATVRHAEGPITVDPARGPSYRVSLRDALREAGVQVNANTHLGDVAVEFWKAFFAPPSDPFDEESYANSRWLDRDVGDRRSLDDVATGGAWDDLWVTYRPRKTLNWPRPGGMDTRFVEVLELILRGDQPRAFELARKLILEQEGAGSPGAGAPPGVEVTQLGLDTVGLELLEGGPDRVAVMVLLRA